MPPVFVIHVSTDNVREKYIRDMLEAHSLPFAFILDGDRDTLTPDILGRWFRGGMAVPTAASSCAFKHLTACRKIIDRNLDGALVLEDDIRLKRRFVKYLEQSLRELDKISRERPAIISYEETRLRYVPLSRRKKGRCLYPGDRDRFAGAYYVNRAAASLILDTAEKEGIDRPIDLFHRFLLDRGRLSYFWCQPCTAVQNRRMPSLIDAGKGGSSHPGQLARWQLRRLWRRFVYLLR